MSKTKEEQYITTIYREFYGHEPNYTSENRSNLTIEIQSMFYILRYLGIICNYSFQYEALEGYKMPISMDLQDILVKMINAQDKENFYSPCALKQFAKEEINEIGYIINNKSENNLESIRLVSSILYSKEYMLPTANDDKLAEFNNCSLEQLKNVYIILKEIQNIIEEKKEKQKENKDFKVSLPYKPETYLKKYEHGVKYIDKVHKYIINRNGINVILELNSLTNDARLSKELDLNYLTRNWVLASQEDLKKEKEKVKRLQK